MFGYTLIKTTKIDEFVESARAEQRRFNNKLIERLLCNAEAARYIARKAIGEDVMCGMFDPVLFNIRGLPVRSSTVGTLNRRREKGLVPQRLRHSRRSKGSRRHS